MGGAAGTLAGTVADGKTEATVGATLLAAAVGAIADGAVAGVPLLATVGRAAARRELLQMMQ
jgi:hypothetical protein